MTAALARYGVVVLLALTAATQGAVSLAQLPARAGEEPVSVFYPAQAGAVQPAAFWLRAERDAVAWVQHRLLP